MKKRFKDREPKSAADLSGKAESEKEELKKRSGVVTSRWLLRIKALFLGLLVIYISVPFVLYCCPWMLGHVIYCHSIRIPFFVDLSRPEDLALNHTVNFYLTPEEGVTVGVWQTVPDSQWYNAQGKDLGWYKEALKDGTPAIIYLHGNLGNRWECFIPSLMCLFQVLSAAEFNVLAVDYRGYGDSTGQPTEAGMTADAVHLYHWVKEYSGSSPVCLWGHSLGSGVATNAALKLQSDGFPVDCVILEAPFTNIYDITAAHPIYWLFPGYEMFIHYVVTLNNMVFANDKNLKALRSHLLLLHAEDDNIVPFYMGQKLYQIAKDTKNKQVSMETYSRSLGFSHNGIYKDPQLSRKIWRFLRLLQK
ncbi:protein ABHD12B [Arapaima gigas]